MGLNKCPQCGLVNFESAETCKRCSANLQQLPAVEILTAVPKVQATELVGTRSNLVSCPDCERLISRHAEACPSCGRFFANYRPQPQLMPTRGWWAITIGWGVIMSGVIVMLITVAFVTVGVVLLGGLAAVSTR